jgi:hypothetical protein
MVLKGEEKVGLYSKMETIFNEEDATNVVNMREDV